jgi:SAM-dependent methyltransferase
MPENLQLYYQGYYTVEQIWHKLPLWKKIFWNFRSLLSNYIIYSLIEKFRQNSVLHWKSIAGIKKSSSIIDIGCGNGDILYEFRKHGFKNLKGIDPYLDVEISNDGIDLLKKSIFEIESKFDFIMFNHSFEHIWEQHEVLEKAKNLLDKKGVILLRIPIINTAFQIYGENWVQIDAPRHFYLHTLRSIGILCELHKLEIFHKYFDSSEFQFIGSEQYKQGISLNSDRSFLKKPAKSIFTQKEIKTFKRQANQFNRQEKGDQVVLFIKKIGEN